MSFLRPTAFDSLIVNGYSFGVTGATVYCNGIPLATGHGGAVLVTGSQSASGIKTFVDGIFVNNVSGIGSVFGVDFSAGRLKLENIVRVDWNVGSLNDASGDAAVDWGNFQLVKEGAIAIDWSQYTLNSNGAPRVGWGASSLYGDGPSNSLNWNTRTLWTQSNYVSLDYNNRQLSGDWLTDTIPRSGQHLVNLDYLSGTSGAILNNRVVRTTGTQLVSGDKKFINDIYCSGAIWGSQGGSLISIYPPLGDLSISGNTSLNWNTRLAKNRAQATTLDYENRQLSGNWLTNTVPTASGHVLNKGYSDAKWTLRVQTADETRTSTTAFTDIAGLSFPVLSGETWQVEVMGVGNSNTLASTGGGASWKTSGPTATWSAGIANITPTNTSDTNYVYPDSYAASLYGTAFGIHSNDNLFNGICHKLQMTILFSANGNFSLQASQNLASVNATTLRRGSYIKGTRV